MLKKKRKLKEITEIAKEKIKNITYGADHIFFLTENNSVFYFKNHIEETCCWNLHIFQFVLPFIVNKLRKIKIESGFNLEEFLSLIIFVKWILLVEEDEINYYIDKFEMIYKFDNNLNILM